MAVSMGTVFDVLVLCTCMERCRKLNAYANRGYDLSVNNKGFNWKGIKQIDNDECALVPVTHLEIFCPYVTKPEAQGCKR